jgi:hypothetical protein
MLVNAVRIFELDHPELREQKNRNGYGKRERDPPVAKAGRAC